MPPATLRMDANEAIFFEREHETILRTEYNREYQPKVMVVHVKGRRYHRVLSGPFPKPDLAGLRRSLKAAGLRNPWTIKGCKDGAPSTPTCVPSQRADAGPVRDLASLPADVN